MITVKSTRPFWRAVSKWFSLCEQDSNTFHEISEGKRQVFIGVLVAAAVMMYVALTPSCDGPAYYVNSWPLRAHEAVFGMDGQSRGKKYE